MLLWPAALSFRAISVIVASSALGVAAAAGVAAVELVAAGLAGAFSAHEDSFIAPSLACRSWRSNGPANL